MACLVMIPKKIATMLSQLDCGGPEVKMDPRVTLEALLGDPSRGDLERGEQRRGVVARVVVGTGIMPLPSSYFPNIMLVEPRIAAGGGRGWSEKRKHSAGTGADRC